jgi:hypothetical protein
MSILCLDFQTNLSKVLFFGKVTVPPTATEEPGNGYLRKVLPS